MSILQQLISAVPDWQSKTSAVILSELQQKTVHYKDNSTYRLVDIAKLIGDENMAAFLSIVKAAGYEWMITEAASGFEPGDDPINARLRLLGHPLSIKIAEHTNRMVSILEQHNVTATIEDVMRAQASMLLEDRKQSLISQNAARWNAFCEAVNNWDGVSPAPEL